MNKKGKNTVKSTAVLLLAGEREGSAPCWTGGTVRGWTCGVVRAGREVFPGGAWAWAGALNRGGRKQVPGGETKTQPAVFRTPSTGLPSSCPGLGPNVPPAEEPFQISLWVWSPVGCS